MGAISTRIATLDDVAIVGTLFDAYRQFYQQQSDLRLATKFIADRMRNDESVILVAEDEDRKVVGFSQMYPTFCSVAAAPICVLYDLFVAPEARNTGAGRALVLAAEQHAAQNGFARMELMTAKTNLLAQSLYESLEWVRDEVFYSLQQENAGLTFRHGAASGSG